MCGSQSVPQIILASLNMATTTVTARGMVSVSVVETVHGTEKKPRSAQHWEEIARYNTQKIAQLGTNVPLAWVRSSPQLYISSLRYSRFWFKGKTFLLTL